MKYPFQIKSLLMVLALLACMPALALTLGGARGAVLVGKPLDVSIALRFEPEEDAASACLEAEVFYGDVRQDSARVRVALVAPATPAGASARVLSSALVDEPMVTVLLRAGCTQKTSRRYVLLSDLPSELAMPANPPLIAATQLMGTSARTAQAAKGKRGGASGERGAGTSHRADRDRRDLVPGQAPALGPAGDGGGGRHASRSSGRSVLKLSSIDWVTERDLELKNAQELLSAPTDDPQRRAEAAALWRVLNMQPEEVMREIARVQGLATDMQVLRDLTTKNESTLLALKGRLQKAESERYANGLVYGLVVMLLLSLGTLIFVWRRADRTAQAASDQDWWHSARIDLDEQEPKGQVAGTTSATQGPMPARSASGDVDIELDLPSADAALSDHSAGLSSRRNLLADEPLDRVPPVSDFSPSMSASLLTVSTQEVVDARQQAEFFVALGEHENAIDVLFRCIHGDGDTSPLVYLDLFKLYHRLGRKTEYQKLRELFGASFRSRIPGFASYGQEGKGLDTYPDAMARITEAWPSARVLDIIEDYLVVSPYADNTLVFDLCAFRDLLMLHALAKNLIAEDAVQHKGKRAPVR